MNQPIVIALILGTLVNNAMLFFGGAYLYFRGKAGASPLPAIKLPSLTAKAPIPAPPPSPSFPCPHCSKPPNYTLAKDLSRWTCNDCKESFPGPKRTVGV